MANSYSAGPWTLDSATNVHEADTRYHIIHGQVPEGVRSDFGYPVADTMNRHWHISPEEDLANARLIAAAHRMFVALAKMVCPECGHELSHHLDQEGCEIEGGDREGYEGEPAQALPPCGCNEEDLHESNWHDYVRALGALRLAKKGESRA